MQNYVLSNLYKLIRVSCVVLLLPATAMAQQGPLFASDEVPEQPEALPRYTVEVIIFAYKNPQNTTELWTREALPSDISRVETAKDSDADAAALDAREFVTVSDSEQVRDEPLDIMAIEYPISLRRLPESQYSMDNVYKRLENLGAYQPLMHFGWTQTIYPEKQSTPINLAVFGKQPPGLTGSMTLYLGRFLHLVMDLGLAEDWKIYSEVEPGLGTDAESGIIEFNDNRMGTDIAEDLALNTIEPPVEYTITEDRKMRRAELHYFDHPKFGVIAKTIHEEALEPDAAEQVLIPDPAP